MFRNIIIIFFVLIFYTNFSIAAEKSKSSGKNRRNGFILALGMGYGSSIPAKNTDGTLARLDNSTGIYSRIGWAFGSSISLSMDVTSIAKVEEETSIESGVETNTEKTYGAGAGLFTLRLYPLSFLYVEIGSGFVLLMEEEKINSVSQYKMEATGNATSFGGGIEFFVGKKYDISLSLGYQYIKYSATKATIITIDEPLENDIEKPSGRIVSGNAIFNWYF